MTLCASARGARLLASQARGLGIAPGGLLLADPTGCPAALGVTHLVRA